MKIITAFVLMSILFPLVSIAHEVSTTRPSIEVAVLTLENDKLKQQIADLIEYIELLKAYHRPQFLTQEGGHRPVRSDFLSDK